MNNVIEELWNGNIDPHKTCGSRDLELEKVYSLLERHKESLLRELEGKHQELFEKYNDNLEEYIYMTALHAFHDGFRLGGSLVAEALKDNS